MKTEEGNMNVEHSKYNGGFMLPDPTKDRLAGRGSTARASSIISAVVGSQRKPDPAPELALQ